MNLILSKNKCINSIVILLTLNKSKKFFGYFADFEQVKKSVSFLLTLNNTGHLWLPIPHCAVPVWLSGHYAMPLVISYFPPTHPFTASATDLKQRFLLSDVFYLTLLPTFFKASLGAGSSTSNLARLPADLRNIVPAQLFVWITAIHKSSIRTGFI